MLRTRFFLLKNVSIFASLILLFSNPSLAYDPYADQIQVDASGFDGNLSPTDTNVQKALQTIDEMSSGGGSVASVNGQTGVVVLAKSDISLGNVDNTSDMNKPISTATLRTINVSSAVNLGLTSSAVANYATILRRTLTYALPATSPYVFTNSDRTANTTPPSIRFRAS